MQCPKCGAILREGAKFCNQCGIRIEQPVAIAPESESKPNFRRLLAELKWIIVIYIILSLCCMSSAFFLGYRTNWILWKLGLR